MFRWISVLLILGMSGYLFAQDASDASKSSGKNRSFVVTLGDDGTFKPRDFDDEQDKDLKLLHETIKYYHERIQKSMNYFEKNKKKLDKDGKYVRNTAAYKDTLYSNKYTYIVNESFAIVAKSGKVESIEFSQRRGRVESNFDNETTTVNYNAALSDQTSKDLILKVDGYFAGSAINREYKLSNVVQPVDRLNMVRNYRDLLQRALRTIDKEIEIDNQNREEKIQNILKGTDLY